MMYIVVHQSQVYTVRLSGTVCRASTLSRRDLRSSSRVAAVSKTNFVYSTLLHSSLSCINECLVTDRGGYVNEYSSRSN